MKVAIVDYGSGNLHSARKAFERAARETKSAQEIVVTSSAAEVASADGVVLPGVGAFADCLRGLRAVPGMVDAITEAAKLKGRPFLGICVGMQLLATRGLEFETCPGLNWIVGDVVKIQPKDPHLKIPHMGWNTLTLERPHPLVAGVPTGETGLHAYFVHSFSLNPANQEDVVATADYGGPIVAMVARENIAGVQFHPEKSQALGLRLIENFLQWRP